MPFSQADFPNLHAGNFRVTRPANRRARKYNCIAWAAGINIQWWEPVKGRFWPPNIPRDYKVASLILAFQWAGFEICADGALEDGIEKIAIYADGDEYMHAARQLESGKWTSKIGPAEEIEHETLEDLEGPAYGHVATFMKRNRRAKA